MATEVTSAKNSRTSRGRITDIPVGSVASQNSVPTQQAVPTPSFIPNSSATVSPPPTFSSTPAFSATPEISKEPKNKKQMKIKRSIFWVIVLVAVLGLYGCWHFYAKYKALTADPNAEAQKVTRELVGVLGKLMELPTDEVPTLATISEKEKLAEQIFFKNAENGDVLFAYTKAMKAILYRPSTNKIINVAPISIDQSQGIEGAKQGASETPKLDLKKTN